MENNNEKELGLMDTLHRCLMCNTEAFEYKENEYKCSDPECKFTWKVMISG